VDPSRPVDLLDFRVDNFLVFVEGTLLGFDLIGTNSS